MSLGASATVCDLLRGVPDTPAALVLTWMLSLLIFTARCWTPLPSTGVWGWGARGGAGTPYLLIGSSTAWVFL